MVGSRLGSYEVLSALGAGGMGEVYRARDTRLGREVAIKVLPSEVAEDPSRLKRFEKEARSASALNHPNIVTIHDIGSTDGVHWISMEKVEGKTLREVLFAGALPVKKLLPIAAQMADGLARAHEAGIVHRDLKPENVMVAQDGLVKILDFGLAKLTSTSSGSDEDSHVPTETGTSLGVVVGTAGYMSPEQAGAQPVDFRSDQFSFGSILYEMATGKRAFQKGTAVDTLSAILHEEPKPVGEINPEAPVPLRWIVERCLGKEPEDRYASTRDLARDLAACRQHISEPTAGVAPLRAAKGKRQLAIGAVAIAVLAAAGAGLFFGENHAGRPSVPSFKRVTQRRGAVALAHFTPDYQSVAYCASWEGKPREAFVQRLASADARPLGITDACVMGAAGAEVLAFRGDRTLLRLPLEGGSPRELVKEVWDASWDWSGTRIAVERPIEGGTSSRIEFPVGNVVVERTRGELFGKIAVSPDGRQLAFGLRHTPSESDWSGDICVTDESRRRRTVLKGCGNVANLVWTPDGKEIWFSTAAAGANHELHAVTLSGRERLVARLPGELGIQDIAPDGRVLATFGRGRWELRGRMAGDMAERNLSWTDETAAPLLSPDGTQIVFRELGEGAETGAMAYHWRLSNSTPTRLGDGVPWDASPDWTTVLVGTGLGEKTEAKLVPIGAGETRTLPRGAIRSYVSGSWHPDGKRIFFLGTDSEGKTRQFVQEIAGGLPQPSAETTWFPQLSRDGRFVLSREKGIFSLHPVDGGDARPLPFIKPGEVPIEFTEDSKGLFLAVSLRFPIRFVRLDLQTGHRDPWLELTPSDLAGAPSGSWVTITPNGRYYAYGYRRNLNDLYVIEGLK